MIGRVGMPTTSAYAHTLAAWVCPPHQVTYTHTWISAPLLQTPDGGGGGKVDCTLPSFTNLFFAVGKAYCTSGAVIKNKATCNVACATGYKPATGSPATGKYTCTNGQATLNGFRCESSMCEAL